MDGLLATPDDVMMDAMLDDYEQSLLASKRGNILPFINVINGRPVFNPSQMMIDIGRAFTAPGRALRGELGDPNEEAFNFASNVTGGGLLVGAPTRVAAAESGQAMLGAGGGITRDRKAALLKDVEEAATYDINRPIDPRQPTKGNLYGRASENFERATDVPVVRQEVEGLMPSNVQPTMNFLQANLGETYLPVYWDRASTNELTPEVGAMQGLLGDPTQGGIGFMRQQQPQLVASLPSIATKIANRADRVRQELGGRDPLVVQMTMAPKGIDFSTHVFEKILSMLPYSKISKADAQKIDEHMRKGKEGDPQWPGINSPDLPKYLFEDITGTKRADLVKKFDSATVQNAGGPSVMEARIAATDSFLLTEPQYFGGATVGRFTGQRGEEGLLLPHRTFTGYVGGDYVGGLDQMLPTSILFRDYVDQKGYMDAVGNFNRIPGNTISYTPEMVKTAIERAMPTQRIDDQMLNEAEFFLTELAKRK